LTNLKAKSNEMKMNDIDEIFGVPEQKNRFWGDKTYNSLCKI